MKYAYFNELGECLYTIEGDAPEGGFLLDTPELQALPSSRLRLEDDVVIQIDDPEMPLEDAKKRANVWINNVAESMREQYLPSTPLQSITHSYKDAEARAYMEIIDALGVPVEADYPHLQALMTPMSMDMQDVAESVILDMDTWHAASVMIEAERVRLLMAIDAAATQEDIDDALASASWPAP